mmetsp:Transcript_30156/g.33688  ORF Transcript_30156/g.33688 Transcript_30156/m.33688 type:complete len:132 (+) Transcript_30156:483-878(+)|eukprot:CAMPEP_0168533880 /NCGR_PEP_ID=MMETSP0405-20121227/17449_1 /TAXON_ID=498012 /ORGANISM="Trichosphaerium sp, Strain Am-I-7 wt" /LENGTH=131 /DNA_ID=CAMNT_0008560243 /DNA_START=311 /DNA_END=706 /DNA_ORIENTATION=+
MAYKVTLRAVENTKIAFVVTNNGMPPQQVLKWGTPFEGICANQFNIKNEKGERLEYQGRMMRRAPDPDPTDFLIVPGNSEIAVTFDLADSYKFTAPGKFSVDYEIPGFATIKEDQIDKSHVDITVDKVGNC